jgi:hypothetical protein
MTNEDARSVASDTASGPGTPPAGRWFYRRDGKKLGPVTTAIVTRMLSGGELPQNTEVWRDGLTAWTAASELPELMAAVAAGRAAKRPLHSAGTSRRSGKPSAVMLAGAALLSLFAGLAWWAFSALTRGNDLSHEALIRVKGRILYEDGGVIPAPSLMLSFTPEVMGVDGGGAGRTNSVSVDPTTGRFDSPFVHNRSLKDFPNYCVCVVAGPQEPLPADIVLQEFSEPQTSQLRADVRNLPLDLRVARPGKR